MEQGVSACFMTFVRFSVGHPFDMWKLAKQTGRRPTLSMAGKKYLIGLTVRMTLSYIQFSTAYSSNAAPDVFVFLRIATYSFLFSTVGVFVKRQYIASIHESPLPKLDIATFLLYTTSYVIEKTSFPLLFRHLKDTYSIPSYTAGILASWFLLSVIFPLDTLTVCRLSGKRVKRFYSGIEIALVRSVPVNLCSFLVYDMTLNALSDFTERQA